MFCFAYLVDFQRSSRGVPNTDVRDPGSNHEWNKKFGWNLGRAGRHLKATVEVTPFLQLWKMQSQRSQRLFAIFIQGGAIKFDSW